MSSDLIMTVRIINVPALSLIAKVKRENSPSASFIIDSIMDIFFLTGEDDLFKEVHVDSFLFK